MLNISICQTVVILGIVLIVTLKYMLMAIEANKILCHFKQNLTDSLKMNNMNSTSTLVLKQPTNLKSVIQPVQ